MKKRRNLILVLLLISALALGVGYAAITGTLTVNGTITVEGGAVSEDLVFKSYAHNTSIGSTISTVTNNIDGKTTAALSITGFKQKGDSITGTFTVQNTGSIKMYILSSPDNQCGSDDTYGTIGDCADFTHTFAWDDATVSTAGIEPGATATFKVTVTMDKIPAALVTADSFTHCFLFTIPATSVAP